MPLFTGEGPWKKQVEILNMVANQILSHRSIIIKNSSHPIKEPILLAYVGHKEYKAIMSLQVGDPHRIKNGKFLNCEIIPVHKNSYLHITQR